MGTMLFETLARVGIGQRLRRALPRESATLVVKQGGKLPLHLVFEEAIGVGDVRKYCSEQCNWHIDGLGVSVDGKHYGAAEGDVLILAPTRVEVTEKVEFGVTPTPVHLEFRRKTGGKG